jgi:ABC-type glycerol-3-phosphate transport system permease component
MSQQIANVQGQRSTRATNRFSRRSVREIVRHIGVYGLLIGLGFIFALPLLWMVSTSLKSDQQLVVTPPVWFPSPVMWENYSLALQFAPFDVYLRNTVTITVIATFGQVVSACFVAYGFARLRFPFREQLFLVVLSTLMLPAIVTLLPTFLVFRSLGWIDTFLPLTVPYFFGGGPFTIFLLRQYFRTIPLELSDAARIDGASEMRIFYGIILPLALPAVATATIFAFMGHWNEFLGPLIYLNDENKKTLMLGLQSFIGLHDQQFQYLMAASTLTALPTLILFFCFQRVFIQSVVLTGLKG